jgi:protein SCO1/2
MLAAAAPTFYVVKGHLPDLQFSLIGTNGATVTEAAVADKVVMLFFGYIHCPDICPTTLAQLHATLTLLGPQASAVRIVFISVDPQRDTPALLQAYTQSFPHPMLGLTGNKRQIEEVARRYRVSYQIDTMDSAARTQPYTVTHSRGIYVFDTLGKAQWLLTDSNSAAQTVEKLQHLLKKTHD